MPRIANLQFVPQMILQYIYFSLNLDNRASDDSSNIILNFNQRDRISSPDILLANSTRQQQERRDPGFPMF